jgi:hypothetical protein
MAHGTVLFLEEMDGVGARSFWELPVVWYILPSESLIWTPLNQTHFSLDSEAACNQTITFLRLMRSLT